MPISSKVLKEEIYYKSKIINTLLEIAEKFGNDKHDTQSVLLINFENDLTSPNTIDSETDPKSDEQQQSHDNKQISSKELSENRKKEDGTNSTLVAGIVTVPKQSHKQQSHYDKQEVPQKKLWENSKGESINSTTNSSIDEQLNEFKGKKKEKHYKYKQSVCSDADQKKKKKSVKNNQWPIGTTAIVGDSVLNGIVEENLCGQGRLVKVKCFPGSTAWI